MDNNEQEEEQGRWHGDRFCPHPGKPCIDGCYFCGRPVGHGPHDHTMTDKQGFKEATETRYSCVCPNC
jgi:hypothetical protein